VILDLPFSEELQLRCKYLLGFVFPSSPPPVHSFIVDMPPRSSKRQKTDGVADMQNGNGHTNGGSAHAWDDLTAALSDAIPKAQKATESDGQLEAFTTSNAIDAPATFGIKSSGSPNTILVTVTNGKAEIHSGKTSDGLFTLSALPEQWQEFMKQTPVSPVSRTS
jgi:hypothetical protein